MSNEKQELQRWSCTFETWEKISCVPTNVKRRILRSVLHDLALTLPCPTTVLGRIQEFGGNFQRIQGISKELKDLYNLTRTYYYYSEEIWEDNVITCNSTCIYALAVKTCFYFPGVTNRTHPKILPIEHNRT